MVASTVAVRDKRSAAGKADVRSAHAELERLRSELAINKAMAENSPVNIMVADRDLRITYVNPASLKTLRMLEQYMPIKAEEVVGQSIDVFHRQPDKQRRILSSDRNLPHRAVISVGPEKAELLATAVYDDAGNYLGPMVTWSVITERLALEERNRDYANQIAALSATQAVVEFKTDGTVLTANDNFLRIMGYTLDEVKGRHHRVFVDPTYASSAEYVQFWEQLSRGESQSGQFLRFDRGGQEVWLQARYSTLLDDNGHVYKVVEYAADISEQIRLEQALKEAEQGARHGHGYRALQDRTVERLSRVDQRAWQGDSLPDQTAADDGDCAELVDGR